MLNVVFHCHFIICICPCLVWIDVASVEHYLNAMKAKQTALNARKTPGRRSGGLLSDLRARASALQASRLWIHHHHLFLSNLTTVRKNFPKRFAKILTRWSVNLIVSMSGCQIRWFRCEHWHSIAFGQEYKKDMLAEGPYSSSHRPPPIALGYIFDHGNGGAAENLRSFRLIFFWFSVTNNQFFFSALVGHLGSCQLPLFSCNLEIWAMTLTIESDRGGDKLNQRAKYLGQGRLVQNVIVQTYTQPCNDVSKFKTKTNNSTDMTRTELWAEFTVPCMVANVIFDFFSIFTLFGCRFRA